MKHHSPQHSIAIAKPPSSFFITVLGLQLLLIPLCIIAGPIILVPVIGVPLFLFVLYQQPFWGIPIFILLHFFLFQETEGISPWEVLFAAFNVVFFSIWFTRWFAEPRIQVFRQKISIYLFIFLFFSVFSIIPGILFQVSLLKWFRELIPLLTLLAILPIMDLVRSKRQIDLILGAFILLAAIVAFRNLLSYFAALESAEALWQLISARQTANEPLFMAVTAISFVFLLLDKKPLRRFIAGFLFVFFGLALLITFSRGYWLATLIAFFSAFLVLPVRKKVSIMLFFLFFALSSVLMLYLFFEDTLFSLFLAISDRFSSLDKLKVDISMLNRLIETKAVWQLIKQNPILGYGLGKTYVFLPLIEREMPTWYVHNAYVYFWFKTGLLGLLSLLLFYFAAIRHSLRCYFQQTEMYDQALALGIFSLLIAMAVVSITSPQFIQKDSLLIMALGIGIVEVLNQKKQSQIFGSES